MRTDIRSTRQSVVPPSGPVGRHTIEDGRGDQAVALLAALGIEARLVDRCPLPSCEVCTSPADQAAA